MEVPDMHLWHNGHLLKKATQTICSVVTFIKLQIG